ncbi:hypothetical protein HII12_003801 [Brettanomyces bruxellensis]|uniref:Uncharacterized protein n=1 Tax=Dekkera bruxellensis TaxID=5007 RepID=A0A8H6BCN1_DEKBR|nr:hypothetical protein HII12_003801 [Brettanomyces bruxellensis]
MIRRDMANQDQSNRAGRNSGGLFSKMRRIFSGVSKAADETRKNQHTRPAGIPQANTSIVRPNMSFNASALNAASNLSTLDMSNLSNASTTFTNRNPNDTLAEFFKRKGDQPLTEIEVEGVMSLINKTQRGSQSMFPNRTTFIYPQSGRTSANNSTLLHGYNQTVIGAENGNKTILRPSNLKEPKEKIAERKKIEQHKLEQEKTGHKNKKQKKYNGGVIDLTHIGEESDGEEEVHTELPHKVAPTLKQEEPAFDIDIEMTDETKPDQKVKQPISKTAAHLLSIIEGKPKTVKKEPKAVEKDKITPKPKASPEKVVKKAPFIDLSKDQRLEILEKKEQPAPKKEEKQKQAVLTGFTIHKPAKVARDIEKPKISIPEFKKPQKINGVDTEEGKKFDGFHFDSNGSFSKKLISNLKQDLKEAKRSANGNGEEKKSFSSASFDFKEPEKEQHVSFAPNKHNMHNKFNFGGIKTVPSDLNVQEKIDSFSFPDVSSSNSHLLHALESQETSELPSVGKTKKKFVSNVHETMESIPEKIPKRKEVEGFVFPTVSKGNASLLSQIDEKTVHLYDSEFIF